MGVDSMPQADSRSITIPLPKALPPAARRQVEAAIEAHSAARDALVAFLDEADGDPDLEPSVGPHPYGYPLEMIDCEGGDVLDEREAETWLETHGNGGAGCAGHSDDDEPSLAHGLDL